MPRLKLPKACSKYGADMGRPSTWPTDVLFDGRLRLTPLDWVDGDYDQGGAYWGYIPGTRIWCARSADVEDGCFTHVYVRAKNREDAKEQIRQKLPNARFYR